MAIKPSEIKTRTLYFHYKYQFIIKFMETNLIHNRRTETECKHSSNARTNKTQKMHVI